MAADPRWRAAQRIPAHADGWTQMDAPPDGEVLWREDGDHVRLTPDGCLAYFGWGQGGLDGWRMQYTTAINFWAKRFGRSAANLPLSRRQS